MKKNMQFFTFSLIMLQATCFASQVGNADIASAKVGCSGVQKSCDVSTQTEISVKDTAHITAQIMQLIAPQNTRDLTIKMVHAALEPIALLAQQNDKECIGALRQFHRLLTPGEFIRLGDEGFWNLNFVNLLHEYRCIRALSEHRYCLKPDIFNAFQAADVKK